MRLRLRQTVVNALESSISTGWANRASRSVSSELRPPRMRLLRVPHHARPGNIRPSAADIPAGDCAHQHGAWRGVIPRDISHDEAAHRGPISTSRRTRQFSRGGSDVAHVVGDRELSRCLRAWRPAMPGEADGVGMRKSARRRRAGNDPPSTRLPRRRQDKEEWAVARCAGRQAQ